MKHYYGIDKDRDDLIVQFASKSELEAWIARWPEIRGRILRKFLDLKNQEFGECKFLQTGAWDACWNYTHFKVAK